MTVIIESNKYMAGSGFIVVGYLAAIGFKWLGYDDFSAIDYGLVVGAVIFSLLVVVGLVWFLIAWVLRVRANDPND